MLLSPLAALLLEALLNRPYTAPAPRDAVSVRCAMPLVAARLVTGEPPPGMRFNTRGQLEGTPELPGLYRYTVEVSDGCSRRLEDREIRVIPAPVLTADAAQQEFHCPQGASPFPAGILRVSGSAPGHPYRADVAGVEGTGEWLRTEVRDGVLPGESSAFEADTIRLTVDPGKLPAGTYTARLRLSTWQGANAPEVLYRLRVDSPQAIFRTIAGRPDPIPQPVSALTLPSVPVVAPPVRPRPAPPRFSRHRPKPAQAKAVPPPEPKPPAYTRSRVLPFKKVVIPPRSTPAPDHKPEAAPERTKPAVMDPPAAKAPKPSPAH